MKKNEMDYVIPLKRIFNQPQTKRSRKAIAEIRRFAIRHGKVKDEKYVILSTEINEFIHKNSR